VRFLLLIIAGLICAVDPTAFASWCFMLVALVLVLF